MEITDSLPSMTVPDLRVVLDVRRGNER